MEALHQMFFAEPVIWMQGTFGLSFVGAAWILLPVVLVVILGKFGRRE